MAQQQAIDQLKSLGFSDIPAPIPQRLICKIGGLEKSGKSHLALTGPQPIIYFSIDIGTEGVVERFQNSGKQVLVYEILFDRNKASQDDAKRLWTDVQERVEVACQVGTGTIVFDTWTETYELARMAHFGKLSSVQPHQYPVVYSDLRNIIKRVYSTEMSAVLLVKMAKAYGSTELEEKGFADTDFLVQTNLRTSLDMVVDPATGLSKPVFKLWVKDCRQNIGLTGMSFSSQQTLRDGQVADYFNLENFIYLVHNWAL